MSPDPASATCLVQIPVEGLGRISLSFGVSLIVADTAGSKSESKDRFPPPWNKKSHERPSLKEKEVKKNPLLFSRAAHPESSTVRDSSREPRKLPLPDLTRVPSSGGSCAPHPVSGTSVWVSGACSHLQMTAQGPQGHSRCRLGVRVSRGLCHPQSGTDKLSGGHPRWKRPLAHSWRPKTRNQPVPVTINYHVPVTQGHF